VSEGESRRRDLRWTDEAILALVGVSEAHRRILLDRIDLIAQFPLMYPVRQRGRFKGLRYFVVQDRWLVFYRVPGDRDILIIAIVPALARPR
jgi:plasmid stabilization system protein ParE